MARWVLLRTNMRNTSLPTLALSDLSHVLGGCKKGCQMQQQQVVNLNVPGAVTVVSVNDFDRDITPKAIRRVDRNELAGHQCVIAAAVPRRCRGCRVALPLRWRKQRLEYDRSPKPTSQAIALTERRS